MMTALTIGALAAQTGCTVPTIRYYEEIGLLPRAPRRPGGHRIYRDADRKRLTFIRRCRDFGFAIEDVRTLIALSESPDGNCVEARDLAQAHLAAIRKKRDELAQLERGLVHLVERCAATCAGGPMKECVIVEDIPRPSAPSCCR